MIKQIKKTSDIDEVNHLLEEGWVIVDLNLNETLLALHGSDCNFTNQLHQSTCSLHQH